MPAPGTEDDDELLKRAIAMSLEEHSRVEENGSKEDMLILDQQPGEVLVGRYF